MNSFIKGAKMDLLYHLDLLVKNSQSKLNCVLYLAQSIPYSFTHIMKSGGRSYMFGNK